MTDIGLKWTKGPDVETAELKDILISSAFPLLKFKKIGKGSINYTHDGAGSDILITEHNLEYEPLFIVLTQWFDIDYDIKRNTFRKAPFIDTLVGRTLYFEARPYVTDTELRYAVSSWTGSGTESITLNFIYAIYYEPSEDI